MSLLFIFIAFLPFVFCDLCNYHATLFETNHFYLTQPYSKEIYIDLANYQAIFEQLPGKLDQFSRNLDLYSTKTAIATHEPLELFPFTENHNAFKTKTAVTGTQAFKACAENNGSLLALTPENKPKVLKLMGELNLQQIPFTALPFQNLLSYPDLEVLDDQPSLFTLEKIWSKSPPFLKADSTFKYPAKRSADQSTTASPASTEAPDPTQFALCIKPNNPWDLKHSRKNWLKMVPQLKTTIRMLSTLKNTYNEASEALKTLPDNSVRGAIKIIKLIIPEPLKNVYDFIDNFTSKKQWEFTKPASMEKFVNFAKNAIRVARLFKLDSASFTNLKKKHRKQFRLLDFNDLKWKDIFDLDEEHYGISGPVSVTPFQSVTHHDDGQDNTVFKAKVSFRIFHRDIDKQTIFHVKPNIIDGKTVRVRTVLQTANYSVASSEELAPMNCHTQQAELFKICHKAPYSLSETSSFSALKKCGKALLSKLYDSDHTFCPSSYPSSDPIIHRAECGPDNTPSIVISSTKPLQLAFICDSEFESTRNYSTFPEIVQTDCEVRQLTMGADGVIIPQISNDFEQDPVLGPNIPFSHPELPEPFDYLLLVATPVVAGAGFLIVLSIFICCCCKYCKCCKRPRRPSFEIGPDIPSRTFQRPLTRPNSSESIPMNDYPLLQ